MTWAIKRQIFYVLILVIAISVLGFLISYPLLSKTPSCQDNKQNGDEVGIDCGGTCVRACLSQVDQISVIWARAFRVVPGRYNAVAYLENHNTNAVVNRIKYKFRFADENNIYIGKREGETIIPAGGHFAVFETAINIGNSIPVYTIFEFTETPVWITVPKEKIDQLKIVVSDIKLENPDTNPVLSATVKNNSLLIISAVNVIAILYDAGGNAISASRTYLEKLSGEEKTEVRFTWPEPISGKVVTKEIIPIFDIFSVKLK
jgi:hypothetical protein